MIAGPDDVVRIARALGFEHRKVTSKMADQPLAIVGVRMVERSAIEDRILVSMSRIVGPRRGTLRTAC